MLDRYPGIALGKVRIYRMDTQEIVFEKKNVICNASSYLTARLFSNNADPVGGIWGLALGSGGSSANGWSANSQPTPAATQTAMVNEIKRKQLAQVQYLDTNGNPTTTITNVVDFTTVLNATTDNITDAIREMGLIGGGTQNGAGGVPTNMLTAPYFNPAAPVADSVILVNYQTLPPLLLPPDTQIGVAWTVTF